MRGKKGGTSWPHIVPNRKTQKKLRKNSEKLRKNSDFFFGLVHERLLCVINYTRMHLFASTNRKFFGGGSRIQSNLLMDKRKTSSTSVQIPPPST